MRQISKQTIIAVLLVFGFKAVGMRGQTAKTSVDAEGNREVIDARTGITVTDKNGKTTHLSANALNSFCSSLEDPAVLAALRKEPGWYAQSQTCEEWAEVQPRTTIEHLAFPALIERLLIVTPPSTTFARYRGMELDAGSESNKYDSTLLPAATPYPPTCNIEATNRGPADGMMYQYRCELKTRSYGDAIALKKSLLESIKPLHLQEDEVREHGLSTTARQMGMCAPEGPCLEADVYASATVDFKFLQIEANPVLTRNALAQARAMQGGREAPVAGMSDKEGSVTFEVFSVGPLDK